MLLLRRLGIVDFKSYGVLDAHIVRSLSQLDARIHLLILLCILLVDKRWVVASGTRVKIIVTSVKIHLL